MDFFSSIGVAEIIAGVATLIGGLFVFTKKYSFDRLDITKSAVERDLILLLREEIQISKEESALYREKYNALEKDMRVMSKEKDEVIYENRLLKEDVIKMKEKLNAMEVVVSGLTEALDLANLNK